MRLQNTGDDGDSVDGYQLAVHPHRRHAVNTVKRCASPVPIKVRANRNAEKTRSLLHPYLSLNAAVNETSRMSMVW